MLNINNSGNGIEFRKYYLKPGFLFASKDRVIVSTVLGSRVSVALYDNLLKFGGINHFIYPKAKLSSEKTTKYGDIAIMALYKTMIEFGSITANLSSMIIGGGRIENNFSSGEVSDRNILIARNFLTNKLKIRVIHEDTGGLHGRKVFYDTKYNRVKITTIENNSIFERTNGCS